MEVITYGEVTAEGLLRRVGNKLLQVNEPCKTMKDVNKLCTAVYPTLSLMFQRCLVGPAGCPLHIMQGALESPNLFRILVPRDIPSNLLNFMGLCVRAGCPLCALAQTATSHSLAAVEAWPPAAEFLLCILDACLEHAISSPELVTTCRAVMSQLQPHDLTREPGKSSLRFGAFSPWRMELFAMAC